MKGFFTHIETAARKNDDYRRVLYTTRNSQLVLMSLKPGEEIGEEVHKLDQFIRIEEGKARVILDGVPHAVYAGDAMVIPRGTRHNVVNTGTSALKLYTLYAPPEHRNGTVHRAKADAEADEEQFDGRTSE